MIKDTWKSEHSALEGVPYTLCILVIISQYITILEKGLYTYHHHPLGPGIYHWPNWMEGVSTVDFGRITPKKHGW